MIQEYTSAKTSVNTLARGFRIMEHQPLTVNLDLGGGRFSQGTEFLAFYGITNLVLDPYNRDSDHNGAILKKLWTRPADTGTCFNVLNVIKEPEIRREVLETLKCMVKPGGLIYIQCYKGNGYGHGTVTKRGWQAHKPLEAYFGEVRAVFKNFGVRKNIIEVINT